jgi:hypothetical protein
VDPTQPIKISYNLPDDVSLYNSKIVAAIRSEGYWNYLHHDFLWQPNLETCKGEIFIPSDVWNRVPADDRFLIVGFFDCLSSCWYFPPTYVVPFDHSTLEQYFSQISLITSLIILQTILSRSALINGEQTVSVIIELSCLIYFSG